MSNGTDLITAERERQIRAEGWTPEHDAEHTENELAWAARCYVDQAIFTFTEPSPTGAWPWDESWWKPSPDPVRNLVKAGALIAAEIDRLTTS